MSYLHADTFDSYSSTTDLGRTYVSVGSGTLVSPGNGRNGTNSVRFFNGNGEIGKAVNPVDPTTAIVSFLHRTSALANYALHGVWDGVSSRGQVVYAVNTDGSISAWRITFNDAPLGFVTGVLLGTTPAGLLFPGVQQAIGFKTVINGATGSVKIWIDGAVRLNLTGINTRNAGAVGNSYTVLYVGMNTTVATVDIDDLIMLDGDATDGLNDYPGDLAGEWSPVTANGASSGWTPLSGTNASNVDDVVPDDDLSYVSTGVTTTKDTYAHAALANIDSGIKLVQVVTVARKSGAGTRAIQHVMRSAGVDHDSGIDLYLATDYVRQMTPYTKDPATGSNWLVAAVNASEIGQKLTV